jgi:hypothetical protein
MVYQHQDTKALEKFINCKGSGSLFNPFTDSVSSYKLHLSAICYHGYHSLLEEKNLLRYCVMGQNVTTKNYFAIENGGPQYSNKEIETTKLISFKVDDDGDGKLSAAEKKRRKEQNLQNFNDYFKQFNSNLKPIPQATTITKYIWNHPNYPLEHYLSSLWIACKDNRVNNYERVSNDKYLLRVAGANENRKKEHQKKNEDNSFEGVHGSCVLSNLETFNFLNFNWDFFHAISNVIKYFMDLMSGERKINDRWRKLCILQGIFPKLHLTKLCPPDWTVSINDQMRFDTVLNSILIPSGVFMAKNDYGLKFPFRHLSYLKGHDKLILLTVYFKFMVSFFDEMPKAYKNFFSQFADDINEMLNPVIEISEHDKMCAKLTETLALHDCLFPDSEKPFCLMQLLDIVHFLKRGGPIRSHWCLFGERALGKISNALPKGGSNYLKTLFDRCTAKENSLAELCVADKLKEVKNGISFRSTFDLDLYSLRLKKTNLFFKADDFSKNYKDDLLMSVINFLNTECISDVIAKSNLYRLRFVYDHHQKQKPTTSSSFCVWIDTLYKTFRSYGKDNFILKNMMGVKFGKRDFHSKDTDSILNWANEGGMYEEDIDGIIKDISEIKTPMIIERAIVKGICYLIFIF